MSARLILLVAAVSLSGCIETFEGLWFNPEKLDKYVWPHNTLPQEQIEVVKLAGSKVEFENEAPEIWGVWAHQCRGSVCVQTDHPERQAVTVLYFHGNGEHLPQYWDRIQILWRLGYTVFAIDYRGYGRSTGEPTEAGIYADARTAMDHVQDRGADEATVVYYGNSLGTTTSIQLATERLPAAVVLEAPFASAQAFIDDAIGAGISSSTLMSTEFDNLGKIPFVVAPKLIMHGTDDDFVRIEFSDMLFEAANGPKQFWRVRGAEHGNVPCAERDTEISPLDDPCIASPKYDEVVGDFLDRQIFELILR